MESFTEFIKAHETGLMIALGCVLVLSMFWPKVRSVPPSCGSSDGPEWVRERALVHIGVKDQGSGSEVIYADLYFRPLWVFEVLLVRRGHHTGGMYTVTCF